MRTRVFTDAEALGEHLAARLLDLIASGGAAGRPFLLGCPTGRSPLPTYRAMARGLTERPQPLAHLVLVMMDEYLAEDGTSLAPADSHYSCRGFARREMMEPWNAALPEQDRLRAENVWFPDPADPLAIERRITDAGGIGFFVLASGAGDGHLAFNGPGTPRDARTRVVELAEQTRRDNMATFPLFRTLNEVPHRGVSLGVATIAEARAGALILSGEAKREAFRRVSRARGYDPLWPATLATEMADVELLADRAAAGGEA